MIPTPYRRLLAIRQCPDADTRRRARPVADRRALAGDDPPRPRRDGLVRHRRDRRGGFGDRGCVLASRAGAPRRQVRADPGSGPDLPAQPAVADRARPRRSGWGATRGAGGDRRRERGDDPRALALHADPVVDARHRPALAAERVRPRRCPARGVVRRRPADDRRARLGRLAGDGGARERRLHHGRERLSSRSPRPRGRGAACRRTRDGRARCARRRSLALVLVEVAFGAAIGAMEISTTALATELRRAGVLRPSRSRSRAPPACSAACGTARGITRSRRPSATRASAC